MCVCVCGRGVTVYFDVFVSITTCVRVCALQLLTLSSYSICQTQLSDNQLQLIHSHIPRHTLSVVRSTAQWDRGMRGGGSGRSFRVTSRHMRHISPNPLSEQCRLAYRRATRRIKRKCVPCVRKMLIVIVIDYFDLQ